MEYRSSTTNKKGFENLISTSGYREAFGGNLNLFFKPFTTELTYSSGVPKYHSSQLSTLFGSGNNRADSQGLNPFGFNTFFEGIISGPGDQIPGNLDIFIDPDSVRTQGLKTPGTLVGWGYDQFGYPAPNFTDAWTTSGTYGASTPSNNFVNNSTHGRDVTYENWLAGPSDMRWDIHRKVWTAPQSIFAAHITQAYINGSAGEDLTQPYFAEEITYDAALFDGVASSIQVTGAVHIGQKPAANSHKVLPLTSGSFCFIVHTIINGRPGYGIYAQEAPASVECSNTATGTVEEFLSVLGQNIVTYDKLNASGLTEVYGGVSHKFYAENEILMGTDSGTLSKFYLQAGTGIEIHKSSMEAGILTFALSSGVAFSEAGVNSTIASLIGLTTPISVSGGGTGTNYKTFVDTYSNQTASGVKTFWDGIKIGTTGTALTPVISFYSDYRSGLFYKSSRGIGIASSGGIIMQFNPTGVAINGVTTLGGGSAPSGTTLQSHAPLVVKEFSAPSFLNQKLQVWLNTSGTVVADVDRFGTIGCGGLRLKTISVTGDYNLTNFDSVCLANASSGNIIIGLPDPTGMLDRVYTIKKTDVTANTVYVSGIVDSSTGYTISTGYATVTVVSDSLVWWII